MSRLNGVLLVDKGPGPTSHDVVVSCRRILKEKRIGHLGTLDPIAGGLLPLAVGQATRLTRFFLMERKSYEGTIRLGYSTDTFDRTGQRTSEEAASLPSKEEVLREAQAFQGVIRHMTPPYSARKVAGKKLYERARQGEMITTETKQIEIFAFDVRRVEGNCVEFFVDCSTGTYVRSLAHELGIKLGCGGHLESLRRLSVGEFTIEKAATPEQLRQARADGREEAFLIPMPELLPEFDTFLLSTADLWEIAHGKNLLRKVDAPPRSRYVKLVDAARTLAAIGEIVDQHACIVTVHPRVVLVR
ncbi:MAG: tRNA pseudouridine(55) synthase TruB [Acidobacteriota bacterium]